MAACDACRLRAEQVEELKEKLNKHKLQSKAKITALKQQVGTGVLLI